MLVLSFVTCVINASLCDARFISDFSYWVVIFIERDLNLRTLLVEKMI